MGVESSNGKAKNQISTLIVAALQDTPYFAKFISYKWNLSYIDVHIVYRSEGYYTVISGRRDMEPLFAPNKDLGVELRQ